MYKVGVMMMGKDVSASPKKVREVILEVEAKTKVLNIFQYLLELQKIKDMNVFIAIQKSGTAINESSTVSQILKYTRPINGVIKLYLYQCESKDATLEKIVLKPSRHQVHNPEAYLKVKQQAQINRENIRKIQREKQAKQQQKSSRVCCC